MARNTANDKRQFDAVVRQIEHENAGFYHRLAFYEQARLCDDFADVAWLREFRIEKAREQGGQRLQKAWRRGWNRCERLWREQAEASAKQQISVGYCHDVA